MKKIFIALLTCAGVVFLGLIGYAGIAPKQFAGNAFLLHLFQSTGAVVLLGIIYFVARLFAAGIRSASRQG